MIKVTCAVIIQNGKVLICQRSETMRLPLKWEFPGGKVELGESEEETIIREIKEELGLLIKVTDKLTPVHYQYPNSSPIELIPFLAEIVSGTIQLAEHRAAKWVQVDALRKYDMAPVDIPVANQLILEL